MSPKIRFSQQREAILKYLSSTKFHPTADTVYLAVKDRFPKISLGTVYRNLSQLAERGEILKLSLGDGKERFDMTNKNHYHFYCIKCNSVIDVPIDTICEIDKTVENELKAKVMTHSMYFSGVCHKCNIN